jgi:hypothetical protein
VCQLIYTLSKPLIRQPQLLIKCGYRGSLASESRNGFRTQFGNKTLLSGEQVAFDSRNRSLQVGFF